MIDCTKDKPWDRKSPGPVRHHNAHEVNDSQRDGWPGGDIVTMRCENCGHEWTKELPQ